MEALIESRYYVVTANYKPSGTDRTAAAAVLLDGRPLSLTVGRCIDGRPMYRRPVTADFLCRILEARDRKLCI